MKTKLSTLTVLLLVLVVALVALVACDTLEQDIGGRIIVTFQFNGGVLKTNATDVEENIKHAYEPNSYVVDVSKYKKYKFIYSGYDFVGWYTKDGTETGDWGDEWDFATQRVTQDTTLYAQWKPSIRYTYSIYSVVEGKEPALLGSYEVEKGATFNDNLKVAVKKLNELNRTFLEKYYSDKECEHEWDFGFSHPGGETSTDIPIYVTSIDGVWDLVDDLTELQKAIKSGGNIYLREDINCNSEKVFFGDFDSEFNGNGHTLSNIILKYDEGDRYGVWSLFGTLGETAKVHDVIFDKVRYDLTDARDTSRYYIAGFATTAEDGCEISNVTVNGTYTYNLGNSSFVESDEIPTREQVAEMLKKAFYDSYDESKVKLENFSFNIVSE